MIEITESPIDHAALTDRVRSNLAGAVCLFLGTARELTGDRRTASLDYEAYPEMAARKLAELERSRKAVISHKRTVEHKLARARELLNSLPYAERAAYDRASRSGRDGIPDLSGVVPPDSRAAAAIAAARSALGKPYVWGAAGPSGFDCSGLMQWSYAHAGIHLPRTSQEQRYAGHQVPLSQAQPGDLVVYRSDASHVAMYVGNGQVIHAPYPGAPVRYDPVDMMPVSSVTRV
jgi:cell wall-associated NlpC family hydrolase